MREECLGELDRFGLSWVYTEGELKQNWKTLYPWGEKKAGDARGTHDKFGPLHSFAKNTGNSAILLAEVLDLSSWIQQIKNSELSTLAQKVYLAF